MCVHECIFIVKFGTFWYTLVYYWNSDCLYVHYKSGPTPGKKRQKKKSSQKLDANCICGAYIWMSIQEWLCVLWMYHFFVVNL